MRIDRLRLVNFRQHEDTELVLGPGLTGIVGPNGAGKSTLLEAIAFAIYGTPAARGNRDTIRRRRAAGRAPVRVELDFSLGPHRYQVTRSLSNAELRQDGDPAPIATTLGAVTERLTRLLGMSRDEFFNTYFTGQKELAVMAAMSAPERAQFLSRVLGYERLRTAQERLRERRSALRARQQALESGLADPAELEAEGAAAAERLARAGEACTAAEAALASAEARNAELRPRLEAMQKLKEAVAEMHGELRLADHKVTETRDRHEQLDRQLAEALGARDRLAGLTLQLEPLSALKQEIVLLDAQEKAVAARQGYEAQLADLRARQRAVLERLAALPPAETVREAEQELDRRQADRTALAARAEELRTGWVRDVQEAKTKRQTLLDQYQDIREQRLRITAAGEDGACPTCRRPLGDEYGNVLEVLQRQLEEVTFNGSFYKQRIEQLETLPPELGAAEQQRDEADRGIREVTERVAQLRAQAREEKGLRDESQTLARRIADLERSLAASAVPYDGTRHAALRGEVAALEGTALEAARLRALADRAEVLVREAEVAERTLSEREQVARELRERLTGMGYKEDEFAALQRECDQVEEQRRQAELAVVRARAERSAAEEALAAAGRRREERRRRESEARQVAGDLALHNELDRAFSDLRTDLNAALRPDLSEIASAFLRDMTAGRYPELELDEDYVPVIVDEGERKAVISGGEEDVANLALRLAISQMIAERAGQPLSLLVLDEIFGSLDEDRRSGVMELLRGLADRFPQVVLITHIESIRDGFDRVLRVDFDLNRGSSMVRDEPGGRDGLAA